MSSDIDNSTTSDRDPDAIRMCCREISRIERDVPVIVQYQSNRGQKGKKTRSGNITNVQALGDNSTRFWFYDPDEERKIQVTLRDTLEGSSVKSQKTNTASTVGSPTRVIADPGKQSVEDLEQEHAFAKRNDDFDVVVAAAVIASNRSVIEWMQTSN